jgi:hypothetical protein
MTGTLRREVSGRLLIINEHHLPRVLTGYLRHHNTAGGIVPRPVRTGSGSHPATADQPR